eukprot:3486414-Alexandrium_andersonii.AAC.1
MSGGSTGVPKAARLCLLTVRKRCCSFQIAGLPYAVFWKGGTSPGLANRAANSGGSKEKL